MKEERGKISGDLVLTDDFRLHGTVTGTITLKKGTLELFGMVLKNVIVDGPEARLNMRGTIEGNLEVRDGYASVTGVVHGAARWIDPGILSLELDSVVGGRRTT